MLNMLMVKGRLARAVALLDEIAGEAAGFVNPDAFRGVIWVCGWFRLLMKDPKEAAHFYRLGMKKTGSDLNIQAMLFEFLTLSELLMGNLAEARRLAGENRVNDIFRSRIALYEGDWKAAEANARAGSRLGTKRRYKVEPVHLACQHGAIAASCQRLRWS